MFFCVYVYTCILHCACIHACFFVCMCTHACICMHLHVCVCAACVCVVEFQLYLCDLMNMKENILFLRNEWTTAGEVDKTDRTALGKCSSSTLASFFSENVVVFSLFPFFFTMRLKKNLWLTGHFVPAWRLLACLIGQPFCISPVICICLHPNALSSVVLISALSVCSLCFSRWKLG